MTYKELILKTVPNVIIEKYGAVERDGYERVTTYTNAELCLGGDRYIEGKTHNSLFAQEVNKYSFDEEKRVLTVHLVL